MAAKKDATGAGHDEAPVLAPGSIVTRSLEDVGLHMHWVEGSGYQLLSENPAPTLPVEERDKLTLTPEGVAMVKEWQHRYAPRLKQQMENEARMRAEMVRLRAERLERLACVGAAARAGAIAMTPAGGLHLVVQEEPLLDAATGGLGEIARMLTGELQTSDGMNAAYKALGYDIEVTPPALVMGLRDMIAILQHVQSGEAPAPFIQETRRLLEAWTVQRKLGVRPWMLALEAILETTRPSSPPKLPRIRERDTAETRAAKKKLSRELERAHGKVVTAFLHEVLASLTANAADVPLALQRPTPAQFKAVADALSNVAVTHAKASRGSVSAWGLASRLSQAFGLPPFPKKSDTARERKSDRQSAARRAP